MAKICRVNNMKLNNLRRDMMYEAIMIDLTLMGVIPRATTEEWLGYKISDLLEGPQHQKLSDQSE